MFGKYGMRLFYGVIFMQGFMRLFLKFHTTHANQCAHNTSD